MPASVLPEWDIFFKSSWGQKMATCGALRTCNVSGCQGFFASAQTLLANTQMRVGGGGKVVEFCLGYVDNWTRILRPLVAQTVNIVPRVESVRRKETSKTREEEWRSTLDTTRQALPVTSK